ncbi:MAG: IgGFc-binding protein, partial [Tannerella sp.]|nr:IgGFc-binding protein [Tannerella sp.]
MRKKLLLLFLSVLSLSAVAQDTEFWFAPPVLYSGTYQGHGGFVFSNPTHRQAVVNIKYYRDGSDTIITIPAYSYNFMFYSSATDITNKLDVATTVAGNPNFSAAVHITSNVGITGYYIYDWSAQQETFMLKGSASAGTQFTMTTGYQTGTYVSGGSGQYGYVYGLPYVGITGTEDGTTVDFTIPSACTGYAAGSHTVTLDKGRVLYLISNTGKMAGTTITSDKPVTVTGGETCRNSMGSAGSGGACDQCGDQIVSDAFAGNTYVMPLSAGFNSASDNYSRMNNYFELIALEPNTNVQIDWGSGLTPLTTLANAGDIYISDTFKVTRPNSCATIIADKPVHIMQNTGHEATLCHLPNFYGTNTHQTSFYSYHEAAFNIYPAASLVYLEASKDDYTISYPGQTETPLFDWITANARWVDGQGDVPQFPGWKYIRFTLPNAAINQIITVKSLTSVFQLGFTSSFNYGTYLNYLTAFNSEFSFDPDTVWTCPGIYTNLIGGIASYYKWIFPDGTIKEGASMNSVKAVQMGMYILEMTQGFNTIT